MPDSNPQENKDASASLEERAKQYVLDCKEESIRHYDAKFKKFTYFDALYERGAAKKNAPYGRANLELPLGFQQIEPFVSQMSEAMIGEAPYISYTGRTPDDDIPAQAITDFTQYQLEVGGFVPAYISYLRNLAKHGTSVMKVIWETEFQTRKEKQVVQSSELDEATGQITPVYEEVEVEVDEKVFDGPRCINWSIFDFFVPKSATSSNVQKMDWVIGRSWRDTEELLKNTNYKIGHKKIREAAAREDESAGSKNGNSAPDDEKRNELERNNPEGLRKFSGKWEVLEFYGLFKWGKSKKDEFSKSTLIVVASCGEDQILLRLEENPLPYGIKPFIMSNDYPVDGEPYGYGELDHIKGLIEEATALRNARLDIANISLNRPWLVERQAGVNLRELHTYPNKVILTNDLNGLRQLDMGGVTASTGEELALIGSDIQTTTEVVNPRQDVATAGAAFGGTARGIDFLSAKTNIRLLTKARIQEETFFKPLAVMLNMYNRELVEDEVYFRLSNEQQSPYRTLPADAFSTQVDFKPVSNPEKLSLLQRKENLSYLLQVIAQIEKVAPGTNNLQELLVEVYKTSGFPHPDRFVRPTQTTIIQSPDGQLLDQKGQPVQVVPMEAVMGAPQNGPSRAT